MRSHLNLSSVFISINSLLCSLILLIIYVFKCAYARKHGKSPRPPALLPSADNGEDGALSSAPTTKAGAPLPPHFHLSSSSALWKKWRNQ